MVYVIACVNGRGVDEKKVDRLIDRRLMGTRFLVSALNFSFPIFVLVLRNSVYSIRRYATLFDALLKMV